MIVILTVALDHHLASSSRLSAKPKAMIIFATDRITVYDDDRVLRIAVPLCRPSTSLTRTSRNPLEAEQDLFTRSAMHGFRYETLGIPSSPSLFRVRSRHACSVLPRLFFQHLVQPTGHGVLLVVRETQSRHWTSCIPTGGTSICAFC